MKSSIVRPVTRSKSVGSSDSITCLSASSRKSVTYMNTGILARNFCSFSRISLRCLAVSVCSCFCSGSSLPPCSRFAFFSIFVEVTTCSALLTSARKSSICSSVSSRPGWSRTAESVRSLTSTSSGEFHCCASAVAPMPAVAQSSTARASSCGHRAAREAEDRQVVEELADRLLGGLVALGREADPVLGEQVKRAVRVELEHVAGGLSHVERRPRRRGTPTATAPGTPPGSRTPATSASAASGSRPTRGPSRPSSACRTRA